MMSVHPDIYKSEVDFTSLALRYPDFAKKLKTNGQLDFSDPECVRQLTNALLHRDFGLRIRLPKDRLCPPVPNRFNYILFLRRLIDSTQEDYAGHDNPERRVIGLDIGTGASAIYPLLGCRQYPSWLFLATEIDPKSKDFAIRNIQENGLESRIKMVDTDTESFTLLPRATLENFDRIDFVLTNPPFYTSEAELQNLAKQKSRPPNSACTGSPVEMICPGGEVGFITKLIKESALAQNRTKIQWFSSMFGKLGSVNIVIDMLRDEGCTNYAVSEFIQGQRTRRWCVAWSWFSLRPSQAVARGTDAVEKKYLPFPTEFEMTIDSPIDTVTHTVQQVISKLHEIQWRWRGDAHTGIGRSMSGDVWSRKARRKLQKQSTDQDSMDVDVRQQAPRTQPDDQLDQNKHGESPNEEPQFVFKITIRNSDTGDTKKDQALGPTIVNVRWLQGHDSTIFESFHGWLKRKLQD